MINTIVFGEVFEVKFSGLGCQNALAEAEALHRVSSHSVKAEPQRLNHGVLTGRCLTVLKGT